MVRKGTRNHFLLETRHFLLLCGGGCQVVACVCSSTARQNNGECYEVVVSKLLPCLFQGHGTPLINLFFCAFPLPGGGWTRRHDRTSMDAV